MATAYHPAVEMTVNTVQPPTSHHHHHHHHHQADSRLFAADDEHHNIFYDTTTATTGDQADYYSQQLYATHHNGIDQHPVAATSSAGGGVYTTTESMWKWWVWLWLCTCITCTTNCILKRVISKYITKIHLLIERQTGRQCTRISAIRKLMFADRVNSLFGNECPEKKTRELTACKYVLIVFLLTLYRLNLNTCKFTKMNKLCEYSDSLCVCVCVMRAQFSCTHLCVWVSTEAADSTVYVLKPTL